MQLGEKIATCCYCGTRTALSLKGKVQHELACGNCGAPLHDLKQMPVSVARNPSAKHATVKPSRIRVKPDDPFKGSKWDKRTKKKKRRIFKGLFEEIWDELEDIFD